MPFSICDRCGLQFCYPLADKPVHHCGGKRAEDVLKEEREYFKDESIEVVKDVTGTPGEQASEGASVQRGRYRRDAHRPADQEDQGDD